MASLNDQISILSRQTAVSVLSGLINDLQALGVKEGDLADARLAMMTIEHQLKLAQYTKDIAMLRAEGDLSDQVLSTMEGALDMLRNIEIPVPGVVGSSGGLDGGPYTGPVFQGYDDVATATTSVIDSVTDSLREAQEAFQRFVDRGIDPMQLQIRDLDREFANIFQHLGSGPDTMSVYLAELQRIRDEFAEPFEDYMSDLLFRDQAAIR
jgi:hypothetical protein